MRSLRTIIVGPDEERRKAVLAELTQQQVTVVAELKDYSAVRQLKPGVDDWDVALLELDSDEDLCLAVAQNISGKSAASTVMVYSASDDPGLLMRSMWAGAREFLKFPLPPKTLTEALLRAATRRAESNGVSRAGKLLVFVGAKGGAGVTTIADQLRPGAAAGVRRRKPRCSIWTWSWGKPRCSST